MQNKLIKHIFELQLDLLQNNPESLRSEVYTDFNADVQVDQALIDQMVQMGFPEPVVRMALENAQENPQEALDFLLQMQGEGNIDELLKKLAAKKKKKSSTNVNDGASTSTDTRIEESDKAYDRFTEDLKHVDEAYLDMPLLEEADLIIQYMRLLER